MFGVLIINMEQSRSISSNHDVSQKDSSSRLTLILDSGAFEQAVSNLRILTDIEKTVGMVVELSNGSTVKCKHQDVLTSVENRHQLLCRAHCITYLCLNMRSSRRKGHYGVTRKIAVGQCLFKAISANISLLSLVRETHVEGLFSVRLVLPNNWWKGSAVEINISHAINGPIGPDVASHVTIISAEARTRLKHELWHRRMAHAKYGGYQIHDTSRVLQQEWHGPENLAIFPYLRENEVIEGSCSRWSSERIIKYVDTCQYMWTNVSSNFSKKRNKF